MQEKRAALERIYRLVAGGRLSLHLAGRDGECLIELRCVDDGRAVGLIEVSGDVVEVWADE